MFTKNIPSFALLFTLNACLISLIEMSSYYVYITEAIGILDIYMSNESSLTEYIWLQDCYHH